MAGFLSSGTVAQVRAANDIIDVIGAVLPLKRAGTNFVALCPFHKEKSPSFNVNPQRQIFHCFGCHKGGDVFSFVQEYESLTFPEALRRLAERARIPLEFENDPNYQKERSQKDSLYKIHEQITERWHRALLNDANAQIAREYLTKRGVPSEAISLFRLGYAPDLWDDTVNWSRAHKWDAALMEQAGLVIRKEGESRCYDRFRGRLIFPICDEQGRVIGFSGRVLAGDEKTAKYVNSPETAIFTKSKVFFGLDKTKRAIIDAQHAIVCEGQLDLIACYMAGVQNMVAPQGTAFTPEHARVLKRYADEVVLCFDSDKAGRNAAVRVLDSLISSGLAIRVASIPAPHDPDSYIKEFGGPAFQQLIQGAEGFFDFYLNYLCDTHDVSSDKGQAAITREMATAVQKTGNGVLIDKYAQKTALRLGVLAEATRAEFKKPGHRPAVDPDAEPELEELPRPAPSEYWLLKLALLHHELAGWLAEHLDFNWLQHPSVRQILAVQIAFAGHDQLDSTALIQELESPDARSLVTAILAEDRPIPNPAQQTSDLVLRLRNQHLDRSIVSLAQQAAAPGLRNEEQTRLLQHQQALRELKRQPLSALADTL